MMLARQMTGQTVPSRLSSSATRVPSATVRTTQVTAKPTVLGSTTVHR